MKRYSGNRGFTLFELLVAVAIFGIISAMAYTGLMQVEDGQKQLSERENRLAQIQMTFVNFERDIEQVVHRPIRNRYGTEEPSVMGQGEFLLELTRGGLRNPAHVARSSLQRVAYTVEDDKLERLYWLVLDQAQDSLPVKQILLDKVNSVDISFLDQAGNWSHDWPPAASNSSSGVAQTNLFPRAISVELKLADGDKDTIKRIFVLPDG